MSARLGSFRSILVPTFVVMLCVATAPVVTPAMAQVGPASSTVATIMDGMTLRQKIGQLFMSRIYGDRAIAPGKRHQASNRRYLDATDAQELMARYHVGSIVYFGWAGNLDDAGQVAVLSNGIQSAAAAAGDVPVLISTDQEHGSVRRLGPPAVQFPGAMAIGATGQAELARDAAMVTGEELRAVGIRQDLAPVADVNANPANPVIGIRSFGSRPELVSTMVAAQVAGLQADGGVAATAKHFPGHGDTDVDSHVGLPVIRKSAADWRAVDAPPFQAAIDAGVDVIMTAHVVVPSLDKSRRPATLSQPIITDILRGEMGFDGVIMTDSLTMAAVREGWGDERVPVLALQAGVDILADPPDLPTAYDAVMAAVKEGELTEERIDRSVKRILGLKDRLGLLEEPMVDGQAVSELLGSTEHKEVSRAVADAGITVLRDRDRWLPLRPDWSVLLTGWNDSAVRQLAGRLRAGGRKVTTRWTSPDPHFEQIASVRKAARHHDLSVVFTGYLSAYPGQRELVKTLLKSGARVVVVDTQSPYDAAWFPSAPGHIVTYGSVPLTMRSLAKVLNGDAPASGRLPVRIPKLGRPKSEWLPVGHGVTWAVQPRVSATQREGD